MKRLFTKYILYCSSLVLTSSLCFAEIYQWRDQDGNLHFGDKPPIEVQTNKVNLKINSYDNVEIIDGKEWADQRQQKHSKSVVMYTATWCGACKKAKHYLRNKGISFQEYDVEKSAKGKRDFAALRGTGVPIVLVGSKRMNGFSPSRFEAIYSKPSNKKSEKK